MHLLVKFILCSFVGISLFVSVGFCADDSFYKSREKGWFWYETEPEPDPEPELVPQASTPQTQAQVEDEMIEISAEWLSENLPILKMRAINNPTTDNLGAYFSAQRVMIDMSSKFADKTTDYFRKEGNFLSEEHRRPTESFMLTNFKRERQNQAIPTLQKIGTQGGLWFFYSSTCPYCVKQLPVMNALSNVYGVDVLYVSLDGGLIPGVPQDKVVFDNGRAATDFNISVTPTTVLVSNDGSQFRMVSQGAMSLPKIQDQLVKNAHTLDWIDDKEYQAMQKIRGTNTVENGNIALKASEINNPQTLRKALEQSIDLSSSPVGTPYRRQAQ